jgi:pSer/pThr/pTyr-binding forkhead associated (FHA) protein
MPFVLEAVDGSHTLVVDKPVMIVGRSAECDIQLDSRKISRRHCCVADVGARLAVRDLGSTNGIRVNGSEVVEGSVQVGDLLTIGAHRYRVRWDETDEEQTERGQQRPLKPKPKKPQQPDGHGTDEDAEGGKPAAAKPPPPARPNQKQRDWGLLEDSNQFEGLA